MLAELAPRTGPERLLDLALRTGPYRLTLADLEAAPHGIDLGPLEPRLPEVLRTPSGKVELAPEPLARRRPPPRRGARRAHALGRAMLLVGRRDLRSNNSWMHNLPVLVRGQARCTAHVHPDDAARLGLADGEPARVTLARRRRSRSRSRSPRTSPRRRLDPARLGPRPGRRAARRRAPSTPASTRTSSPTSELLEPLTGTAVLNGIPVTLEPVGTPVAGAPTEGAVAGSGATA